MIDRLIPWLAETATWAAVCIVLAVSPLVALLWSVS